MQMRPWALLGVALVTGACSTGSLSSAKNDNDNDAAVLNDDHATSSGREGGLSEGASGTAEGGAGGAGGASGGRAGADAGEVTSKDAGGASGSGGLGSAHDAGTTADASLPAPAAAFSVLTPGSTDTITTTAGAWSFGKAADSGGGSVILLNGNPAGLPFTTQFTGTFLGSGVELVVANQSGQVYVRAMSGLWYKWNSVDQWTAEVSGDPRSPNTPPLGPNLAGNSDFSMGLDELHSWFFAAQNDLACDASSGCSYTLENVSPKPGGHSVHLVNHDHYAVLFNFFSPTVAETYLISVWTTGLGGLELHEEHDSTGTKGAKIVPSTGWVQTLCTFEPVKPSNGQLLLKVYASDVNATDIYIGKVAAAYPAPRCQTENPSVSIKGY